MRVRAWIICLAAAATAASGCTAMPVGVKVRRVEGTGSASATAVSSLSATAVPQLLSQWYSSATNADIEIWFDDLQTVESTAAVADPATLADLCLSTSQDASHVHADLPAPDPSVTADLTAALSASTSATQACAQQDYTTATAQASVASGDIAIARAAITDSLG